MKHNLKKVKSIYYAETEKEKEVLGGSFCTGLAIELEDGRVFRQQTTDPIMSFEQVKIIKK